MNALSPVVIAGEQALAQFRQGLTGPYALDLLNQAGGRLLIQLPVGAGKSEWMVKIIVHALSEPQPVYDLLIVLVPRWDILRELLKRLPAELPRKVLHPRPRKRCGSLDAEWQQLEQHGCGFLGRAQLCQGCPKRKGCTWPGQYGKRLRGTKLILATQQHLVINPRFVQQLTDAADAQRPLILLDESDLLLQSGECALRQEDLARFITAQESVLNATGKPRQASRDWLELSRLVNEAPSLDLREGRWRFPYVDARWALEVQKAGRDAFGREFRFLGYDLHRFSHSDPASRERPHSGDIRFATLPSLGKEFMIFSGSIARELARYRLDPNHRKPTLLSPFDAYRFEHPHTRWFNIRSLIGTANYFPGNAESILDFFARKIARNIAEGKRTLLIARKKFVPLCQSVLRERLDELGVGPVRIVTGSWDDQKLNDPRVLPLINYGVSGINRFEQFDAAYCLCSYYVSAETVSQAAQDIDAVSDRFQVVLDCRGNPPLRRARLLLPDQRETILSSVVQWTLEQKEADVVVQAAGRVRPFTQPREVITFQIGELPGVRHTHHFTSLEQARAYFEIPARKAAQIAQRAHDVRQFQSQGLSLRQIAEKLGVSRETVKRYLKHGQGQNLSS